MHAILVTPETMPKIQTSEVPPMYITSCNTMLHHPQRWYLVRGYVDRMGKFFGWTVLPAYIIEKYFEHDQNTIKSDWDQIVRNN